METQKEITYYLYAQGDTQPRREIYNYNNINVTLRYSNIVHTEYDSI